MSKTKIGMVTFYRANYGAFCQALALQKTLISLGYEPEIIDYDDRKEEVFFGVPKSWFKNRPKRFFSALAANFIKYANHKQRNLAFLEDISRLLCVSNIVFKKYDEVCKYNFNYDLYLTGSDQMFNPTIREQGFLFRMLSFARGAKASYAASSGYDHLDNGYIDFFKQELSTFKAVSVREKSLSVFINENLGINSVYNIDPSLLLTKEEWLELSTPIHYGRYIFFYHAGMQDGLIDEVNRLSDELNLPVLVADKDCKVKNQIKRRKYFTPTEWIYALNQAEYVITNSFHGTAFCINFHKKAYVIANGQRSERIVDLLTNCGLKRFLDKALISDEELSSLFDISDCYLKKEREKARKYLASLENVLNEKN